MTKNRKNMICGNKKHANSQKLCFYLEKIRNFGLNKLLGHVSLLLMKPLILLGIKKALRTARKPKCLAVLMAQAIGRSSSCGFLLLPGPTSSFF
jgi:hypothetical protein